MTKPLAEVLDGANFFALNLLKVREGVWQAALKGDGSEIYSVRRGSTPSEALALLLGDMPAAPIVMAPPPLPAIAPPPF